MLSAIKDLVVLVSAIVALAYTTGQEKWLWKQIATIRNQAVAESRSEWGCPSIFDRHACRRLKRQELAYP